MAEWNDFGWKQLADEAQAGMRGQGAIVEAMHRLTVRSMRSARAATAIPAACSGSV